MNIANLNDIKTIKNFEIIEKLGGFSSDNYIATINGKKLFFKVYKNKSLYEVEKLENIVVELSSHNLPVAKPITIENQQKFIKDGQIASLFPLIDGKSLHGNQINSNLFSEIVSVIGSFNNIKNIKSVNQTTQDLYENKIARLEDMDNMLKYIKENPIAADIDGDTTKLLIIKKQLVEEIDTNDFIPFLRKKDLVHGDFHNENLLFKDNKLVGIVDFELSHWGNRMEDIINFILFAFCNNDFSDKNLIASKEFLKEYHKEYPFTFSELKFGVDFNIYRFASSVVLEEILYKEKNMFFYELIKRDLRKFQYFKQNKIKFIKSLS